MAIRYTALPLTAVLALASACTGTIEEGAENAAAAEPAGLMGGRGAGGAGVAAGVPAAGTGGPASGGSIGLGPASCSLPSRRLWRLTPAQYTRSVMAVFPHATAALAGARLTEELAATIAARATGFSSQADAMDMTDPHVLQLLQTARKVAAIGLAEPAKVAACLGTRPSDAACVREVVGVLARRAFRRDIAAAELDGLMSLYQQQLAAGADGATALRQTATALLMSPQLLYRTELGPDGAKPGATAPMTGFERASALSYLLTDGPPDDALLAAARAGKLESRAELELQARRLLAAPEAAAGLMRFFAEHFDTHDTAVEKKDTKVFAPWNASLAADMSRELDLLIGGVLAAGSDARLETLFTADWGFVNGRLGRFYGIDAIDAAATEFRRVTLPNRGGLPTRAGLMASLAHENDTDPVGRGKYVRATLLCQALPPPPQNVNVTPVPPDGRRTQRERLAQHSADPACSGCHALMDPLGLAFERYDGIGRYRAQEAGKTIDPSGALTMARPEGARFEDAIGLSRLLARSPEGQGCFARKAYAFAHGREPLTGDACALERLVRRFETSGADMLDLFIGIVTDEAFFLRRVDG